MSPGLTIKGIQEAQQGNLEMIASLQPSGAFGRAVQYGLIEAHRYAVAITHVMTGSLRASHRMRLDGLRGRLYIDPQSVNPRTGERPADYGITEHKRGGSHAFYERTYYEAGKRIAHAVAEGYVRGLRR
jgi:hypothetical protein